MGFSLSFSMIYKDFGFEHQFFSSPDIKPNKRGINPQGINIRSVLAFREIGRGREAMVTFTTIMNIPTPMNKDNFDSINDKLYNAYMRRATESMKWGSFEVRKSLTEVVKMMI